MKAVRYHATGGPEVLQLDEIEAPSAGPGQLLIKVAAASINRIDLSRRAGQLPQPGNAPLPIIPGQELAGTVESVGEGVSGFKVGDRVLASASGAYAEYAAAAADSAYIVPPSIDLVDAATLQTAFATAWGVLVSRGKVQKGETVLLQSVGSGVGIALVQVAKHLGATVIGTAGSDDKLEWAKQYGLDYGINYRTQDIVEETKKLTEGKGLSFIAEGVGGEVFTKSMASLGRGGRMVLFGAASGDRRVEIFLPDFWNRGITLMGAGSGSTKREDTEEILRLVESGALKATVDKTWPLAQAADAHRYIENRSVMGKVALTT